jgi:CRP/FNR family cyclic AMP-dependent transcriptional regulator
MPSVPPPADLIRLPLFRDLTPEQLAGMHRWLAGATFQSGATLVTVEQPGEAIYVILSGTVKVHVDRADGSEVMLAILGPGEVIGEMSAIDRLARSATVVAMEATTTLWIDRATFRDQLFSVPALAINLVAIMSRRLRLANAQIQALAGLDVYGRVARQLLALAEVYGESASGGGTLIQLRLTQSDLAALVGASRVRVNQVLGSFRQLGYVASADPYRIIILDAVRLGEYCV